VTIEMGFGMAGIEPRIIYWAGKVAERFDQVTYVEIGVGEGATLSAVASALKESGKKWRAIGVELPNGYSFNRDKTADWALRRGIDLNFKTPNGSIAHPPWGAVTVYFKDSQSFLTELWQSQIQLALIDGCHGKPCVKQDFMAVEAFSVPGTVVMFHDYGEDQRGHYQPHCPTGLDVLGACEELGLLAERRKGWKFLEKMTADRLKGGWDMGLFERVSDG